MLAVTGGKGGVEKTTTALGVAAVLAQEGHSPVAVDADLDAPDLAAMAGVDGVSLGTVAAGESLSAAPTVAGVTVVGTTRGVGPASLERVFDRLSECRRPVVVDCPAGTGTDHGLALRAADDALLVTRSTRQAVVDALKTETLARRLGATPRTLAVTGVREVSAAMDTPALPPAVAVPPVEPSPGWQVESSRFETLLRWT